MINMNVLYYVDYTYSTYIMLYRTGNIKVKVRFQISILVFVRKMRASRQKVRKKRIII